MVNIKNNYKGIVVETNKKYIIVDCRLKCLYNIPIIELAEIKKHETVAENEEIIGREIVINIESLDPVVNKDRTASYVKARFEDIWSKIDELHKRRSILSARVTAITSGGYDVHIDSLNKDAFMPNSLAIFQQNKDSAEDLLNTEILVMIILTNKRFDNILVSAREVVVKNIEDSNRKKIKNIKVGDIISAVVISITAYGVFLSVGSRQNALIPIDEASWQITPNLQELFYPGQMIEAKVLDITSGKLFLSYRALQPDPLDSINIGDMIKVQPYRYIENIDNTTDRIALLATNEDRTITCFINTSNLTSASIIETIKKKSFIEVYVEKKNIEKRRIIATTRRDNEKIWKEITELYNSGDEFEVTVTGFGTGYAKAINLLYVTYSNDYETYETVLLNTELHYINTREEVKNYKIGDKIKCVIIQMDNETKNILISHRALFKEEIRAIIQKLAASKTVDCVYSYSIIKDKFIFICNNLIEVPINSSALSQKIVASIQTQGEGRFKGRVILSEANPYYAEIIEMRDDAKRSSKEDTQHEYASSRVTFADIIGDQLNSIL